MLFDPYETCPCGNGKKFKFCCIDLAEPMEKVIRHQQNNQLRMALRILSQLDKKHPDNPWVLTTRTSILLDDQQLGEAREILERLLEKYPEHVLGTVLYATVMFADDGFEASKQSIDNAFLSTSHAYPDLISNLAMRISMLMFVSRKYLAARQFLTLAMRLAEDDDQKTIFLKLLQLDSDQGIPYPLRSVHQLVPYHGSPDIERQAAEAMRLVGLGCYGVAADLLTRLGEEEPDNAGLWQNAGFCRAWAGDEVDAADALHLSARLHEDFETSVELETIAQLLDVLNSQERARLRREEFRVNSVARLLTQLDGNSRIARLELPQPVDDGNSEDVQPTALFLILDRPALSDLEATAISLQSMPNVIAKLSVFDADPQGENQARAFIGDAFEGQPFDDARAVFEEAAGDEIDPVGLEQTDESTEQENERDDVESIPRQLMPMHWHWHFPLKTTGKLKRDLRQQKWRQVVDEIWSDTKQESLRDKTPLEAAGDPELKVALAAAVFAFEAICEGNDYSLDVAQLCEQLQLDLEKPIPVSDTTPLNSFSSMQLHRLAVGELSDHQLQLTLQRALLIHHSRFLESVLREVLERPSCVEKIDLNRAYSTLSELCRKRFQFDDALQWIAKGRQAADTQERASENRLQWELRELNQRREDPDDPELNTLLERIHRNYCSKIPELQTHLEELCEDLGVPVPWHSGAALVAPGADSGSTTVGGIWTPDSAPETGGAEADEKKLWLPGQ